MPESIKRKAARCKKHGLKPEVFVYDYSPGVVLDCPKGCDVAADVSAEKALDEWNDRNAGFFRRNGWLCAVAGAAVAAVVAAASL